MADSTCMVRGFSYPSVIPNESKQDYLMLALGDSVSFGRFLNESLSWEKRSAFSQKNYVEEAEQYSRPGSVAQKKAFFEAHYKKIAAKKAADVVDQKGAEVCQNNIADEQWVVVSGAPLNVHVVETKCVDITDAKENLAVYNDHSSVVVVDQKNVVDPGDVVLQARPVEKSLKNEAMDGIPVVKSLENDNSDNRSMGKSWEDDGILVKEGLEEVPVGRSHVHLENQDTPKSPKLNNLESCNAVLASEASEITDNGMLWPDMVASADRNIPSARIEPKTWKDPSTLSEQVSLLKKEQNATQGTTKDVKNSPSRSLHALSEPSFKKSSSATRKTDSIRLACSSDAMIQSNSSPSDPASIPQLNGTRLNGTRMETPQVSSSLSKSTRWRLFSAVFSKSSGEKCARKSDQFHKCEENLKASKSQKMQLRKSLKEKAGNGFRKLVSCFNDPSVVEDENRVRKGSVSTPPTRLDKNSLRNNGAHR